MFLGHPVTLCYRPTYRFLLWVVEGETHFIFGDQMIAFPLVIYKQQQQCQPNGIYRHPDIDPFFYGRTFECSPGMAINVAPLSDLHWTLDFSSLIFENFNFSNNSLPTIFPPFRSSSTMKNSNQRFLQTVSLFGNADFLWIDVIICFTWKSIGYTTKKKH